MGNDPIIEQLHAIRANHTTQFQGDLRAMVEALKEIEQAWLFPLSRTNASQT
jgi:hypothetical protein